MGLVGEFYAVFLDHRVRQDFVRNGFDVLLCLFARHAAGKRDLKELALAHAGNAVVPMAVQCRPHGLTLRIEHGGLQGNKNSRYHFGTSIIARHPARTAPNVQT